MKKRILSAILVLIMSLTALTSCAGLFGNVEEQGDVTVVVEAADGSYEVYKTYLENVENKSEGAKGVLESLRDREENPLHLVMDSTSFVTEIGSVKQDAAAGEYVMIYTSLESDSYPGADTLEYEGTLLYKSGFGITGMKVNAGIVILFRLETFS